MTASLGFMPAFGDDHEDGSALLISGDDPEGLTWANTYSTSGGNRLPGATPKGRQLPPFPGGEPRSVSDYLDSQFPPAGTLSSPGRKGVDGRFHAMEVTEPKLEKPPFTGSNHASIMYVISLVASTDWYIPIAHSSSWSGIRL